MKKVLLTFAFCIYMCGNAFSFELLDNINKAGEIGTEVEQLKKENELLKKEVESLKVEIESIKDFLELQKIMNNYYDRSIKTLDFKLPEQALLNPSESKFSIISCRGGLFTVSCENIRKYSTGSEVTIEFVNLYSATMVDNTITVEYAKEFPNWNDLEKNKVYLDSRKEKTEKLDDIKSGKAKSIKIRIPEYTPEELKFIGIKIQPNGITYQKENR